MSHSRVTFGLSVEESVFVCDSHSRRLLLSRSWSLLKTSVNEIDVVSLVSRQLLFALLHVLEPYCLLNQMPDKRSTLFIKQVSGKMLSNVTPDIQIKMSKKVLLKIKELARRSLVFIPQAISFTST